MNFHATRSWIRHFLRLMLKGDPKPQQLLLAFKMLTSRAGSAVPFYDFVVEIGSEAADHMIDLQLVFYFPPIKGWDGQAPPSFELNILAPCVPSLLAMRHILDRAAAAVPPAARVAAAGVVQHQGKHQASDNS